MPGGGPSAVPVIRSVADRGHALPLREGRSQAEWRERLLVRADQFEVHDRLAVVQAVVADGQAEVADDLRAVPGVGTLFVHLADVEFMRAWLRHPELQLIA